MNITIKNELDPLFEIFSLLLLCHTQNWKEELVSQLDDYGVNGRAFFEEELNVFEKYVDTFQKYRVTGREETALFEHVSYDTSLLILALAVEKRSCLEHPENLELQELRSLLAYFITDTGEHTRLPETAELPNLPDENALLDFMDTADVKDEEKWFVLNLLRKADYWLSCLFETVNANKKAYDKALEAVEKPLLRLLEQSSSCSDPEFLKIAGTCADAPLLRPTLAMPLIQIVLYKSGYFGLFTEALAANEASCRQSKDAVLRQLKALGDKSKLDILCALRDDHMYNLKLSEHLGLSPSTVSHHMNVLLGSGFITVEKKEGKVYYCLHREHISQFISALEHMLIS